MRPGDSGKPSAGRRSEERYDGADGLFSPEGTVLCFVYGRQNLLKVMSGRRQKDCERTQESMACAMGKNLREHIPGLREVIHSREAADLLPSVCYYRIYPDLLRCNSAHV